MGAHDRLCEAMRRQNVPVLGLVAALAKSKVKGGTRRMVQHYRKGTYPMPSEFIREVARVLRVREEWLLSGTGEVAQHGDLRDTDARASAWHRETLLARRAAVRQTATEQLARRSPRAGKGAPPRGFWILLEIEDAVMHFDEMLRRAEPLPSPWSEKERIRLLQTAVKVIYGVEDVIAKSGGGDLFSPLPTSRERALWEDSLLTTLRTRILGAGTATSERQRAQIRERWPDWRDVTPGKSKRL